jgi:hypothetical protein
MNSKSSTVMDLMKLHNSKYSKNMKNKTIGTDGNFLNDNYFKNII